MPIGTIIIIAVLFFLAAATALIILLRSSVKRVPPWMLVIAVLIATAGAGVLLSSWRELKTATAHLQWPVTDATVVESHVIGARAYRPSILFEYTWEGRTYRDSSDLDMPGFGGRSNKRNTAEHMAEEYPAGRVVKVHVDPQNPRHALLKAGPKWDAYGKIGLGGVLIGLAGLIFGLRLGRKS